MRDVCTAQSQVTKDLGLGTPQNRKVIWTKDLSGLFGEWNDILTPSYIEKPLARSSNPFSNLVMK
jgi:hypothetical protein